MVEKSKNLIRRPPVVVVMGHIDHGKSKLLDYIRQTNLVEKEKGGITQHIGAYEAEIKGRRVTFLDTPGHEAFSKMRIRGAKIADIAILVIAADDGVKPQTLEAYKAIEGAKIPFVVAINKIDKPEADPERVKAQLTEHQIFVENYGGKVPSVNISAKTGQGIDELLDLILLVADMEDLKADPKENASGYVVESNLDQKRGISATLIIQNGKMKKGMYAVSGDAIAPVRIFEDFKGKSLNEAKFSSPVRIVGFNKLPHAGFEFETLNSKKEAEEAARLYFQKLSQEKCAETSQPLISEEAGKKIIVPIVIKTDVGGSLEAVEKEIKKLEDGEVCLNILRKDVGNVAEEDVRIASSAKDSIILGFNVKTDATIKNLAERFGIIIFTADIIYEISEWLEKEIEKRKKELVTEEIVGKARILKVFSQTKNKQVLGGEVLEGKIVINSTYVRIKRNEIEIGQGKIKELQHNKAPVKEVNQGQQFGLMMDSKIEMAKGDVIEIVERL